MSFQPIKLDKERLFKYGMKAISLIEKELKTPIGKIDFDSTTMEDLAVIVWAGLQHEDRELTPDKVMDLIDDYSDIKTVTEAMNKAFQSAFGVQEGKNE